MSSIGEVIATGRIAAGLTPADLAASVGITQAALSRYENDLRDPDTDVLARIGESLGVTMRFLKSSSHPSAALAVDAHMRRRATARPTLWRQLEAKLNMLRMHSDLVREEVAVNATLTVPGLDPFSTEPADAARMTRTQWKTPTGPIRALTLGRGSRLRRGHDRPGQPAR